MPPRQNAPALGRVLRCRGKPPKLTGEETVRTLTAAGITQILPAPWNQLSAQHGSPRKSQTTAVGISPAGSGWGRRPTSRSSISVPSDRPSRPGGRSPPAGTRKAPDVQIRGSGVRLTPGPRRNADAEAPQARRSVKGPTAVCAAAQGSEDGTTLQPLAPRGRGPASADTTLR